jgi:hypothetical protein
VQLFATGSSGSRFLQLQSGSTDDAWLRSRLVIKDGLSVWEYLIALLVRHAIFDFGDSLERLSRLRWCFNDGAKRD